MPERIHKVVETISNNATPATYSAGVMTAGFSLASLQSYAWVITTILCILTFAMNLYFKRKNDKRQDEQHKLNQAQFMLNLDSKADGPISKEYIKKVMDEGMN